MCAAWTVPSLFRQVSTPTTSSIWFPTMSVQLAIEYDRAAKQRKRETHDRL